MSLLRKKKNTNSDQKFRVRLGSTNMKSSAVSSVVAQLQEQGYSGDLLSGSGMNYNVPNPATENANLNNGRMAEENFASEEVDSGLVDDSLLVDDIDFDANNDSENISVKVKSGERVSRKEILQKQRQIADERAENSKMQVEKVGRSAKKLYDGIDSFIDDLRIAADNARDNQVLCMRLERLRKMCLSFARGVQANIPGYAASLFVNPEEDNE
jgi:hypothetical protein